MVAPRARSKPLPYAGESCPSASEQHSAPYRIQRWSSYPFELAYQGSCPSRVTVSDRRLKKVVRHACRTTFRSSARPLRCPCSLILSYKGRLGTLSYYDRSSTNLKAGIAIRDYYRFFALLIRYVSAQVARRPMYIRADESRFDTYNIKVATAVIRQANGQSRQAW